MDSGYRDLIVREKRINAEDAEPFAPASPSARPRAGRDAKDILGAMNTRMAFPSFRSRG